MFMRVFHISATRAGPEPYYYPAPASWPQAEQMKALMVLCRIASVADRPASQASRIERAAAL
jgi:hypothetical protein